MTDAKHEKVKTRFVKNNEVSKIGCLCLFSKKKKKDNPESANKIKIKLNDDAKNETPKQMIKIDII